MVYEAVDLKFSARVALKVARVSSQGTERYRREARVGYLLGKAPGFVRALDWGEFGGDKIYLAMDLIPNARPLNLYTGSPRGRLRALARAAQLVRDLHGQGLVHRDVKPDNLLLDTKGELYLADFGASREVGAPREARDPRAVGLTQPGVILGTPLFMPPEQFRDPSGVDGRADVYALGVMLYVSLTGRFPYAGASPIELMASQGLAERGQGVAPAPRELDEGIPPALSELAQRAISLRREERPESAALARDLALACGLARPRRASRAASPPRAPAGAAPGFPRAGAAPGSPAAGAAPGSPGAGAAPGSPRVGAAPGSPRVGAAPGSPGGPARPRAGGPARPRRAGDPDASTREALSVSLGLDEQGFLAWRSLEDSYRSLGPRALREALGPWPALRVRAEKPIQGETRYEGQLALLCPRRAGPGPIALGRTLESDLTVALPSMSKLHARFARGPAGWTLTDLGSSNGTEVEGAPLAPNEPRELADHTLICFAQHLTCDFLTPAAVLHALALREGRRDESGTLHGSLGKEELVELLQMIEFNAKTGQLQIQGSYGEAWLSFDSGRLRGARLASGQRDEEALTRILADPAGSFTYHPRLPGELSPGFDRSISRLLLDLARAEDERAA